MFNIILDPWDLELMMQKKLLVKMTCYNYMYSHIILVSRWPLLCCHWCTVNLFGQMDLSGDSMHQQLLNFILSEESHSADVCLHTLIMGY